MDAESKGVDGSDSPNGDKGFPGPAGGGDFNGYSADDSSLDLDDELKEPDLPHVAEVQHSKPKPRFKGKYNIISRLFLL